jgi:soluble lytic murein transglycosylase
VKISRQSHHRFLSLFLLGISSLPARSAIRLVTPQELRQLAAPSEEPRAWPPLRRYAQATPNREAKGLAYFVLGYREYRANLFGPARSDLHVAATTDCRLADFADYYEALADQQLHRNTEGVQALQDLLQRYPQSPFRLDATALLADLLIQARQPKQAIELLKSTPGAQKDSGSLLALAKAYEAEPDDRAAASIYQQIYYEFPLSPSAGSAETALERLRASLGASYPFCADARETARAEKLFEGAQYDRALKAYETLLKREPRSAMADQWVLGQARCLLRLGHYDEAAETLLNPMQENETADGERLRLLVHIYERADDEPSMLGALGELYDRYPRSSAYADALFFAGSYFSRHGFWQTAAPYYQRLAGSFAATHWAPQAAWWIAWYKVLAGNDDDAAAALESYLQKYPNSFHVPAALYWLGRIKQHRGFSSQSRSLYLAVESRFPNSYYGLKARREMGNYSDPPARDERSRAASDPSPSAVLASLKLTIPPASPPIRDFSSSATIENALNPAVTLAQLSLQDVLNQVIPQIIRGLPRDPGLFFALAHVWSEADEPALALFAARNAVPDYQDYPFSDLPREEWRFLYPSRYWTTVRAYARLEGLNPYLVMGLIRQESAFDPKATSAADARGLMQIRPGTAATGVRNRWRRRRIAQLLYSPRYNIRVSSRYLRDLFRTFGSDPGEAIAAYNAGDVWVKEWLANGKFRDSDEFVESIPFGNTRVYVESVLRDAAIYRSVLTGSARFTRVNLQEN